MIKTFFDFCSGIGAGRLGLERCGLKCVGHSDTSRLADCSYRLLHQSEDKNYGNLKFLEFLSILSAIFRGKQHCLANIIY